MAGNYAVSKYKAHVAKRIQSKTMEADATHSWLDVMSSLGALVGLIGVALGFRWADPIAGFAATLFICHVGYEVTSEIVRHLMDGVEPRYLAEAEQAIAQVPGLSSATVRGRCMGSSLILEIEGELPGKTTMDQAAQIGQQVETAVLAAVAEA